MGVRAGRSGNVSPPVSSDGDAHEQTANPALGPADPPLPLVAGRLGGRLLRQRQDRRQRHGLARQVRPGHPRIAGLPSRLGLRRLYLRSLCQLPPDAGKGSRLSKGSMARRWPQPARSVLGLRTPASARLPGWNRPVWQRRHRFPGSAVRVDQQGLERPTDGSPQVIGERSDRPGDAAHRRHRILRAGQEGRPDQADAHRLEGGRSRRRRIGLGRRRATPGGRTACRCHHGLWRLRRLAPDTATTTCFGASNAVLVRKDCPGATPGKSPPAVALELSRCGTCRGRPCSFRPSSRTAPSRRRRRRRRRPFAIHWLP